MQASLARTGIAVFAMLFAITFLTEHVAAGRALVATGGALDLPQLREIVRVPIDAAVVEVAVADFETTPRRAAAVPEVSAPLIAAHSRDATVVASWYGPGFYGNRTACGETLTPELLGVAHLTLPCGTTLTLTYGSRSITVAVIDRGPYIDGRTLDLSNATRITLGCTDLCTLRMRLAD
jgi:rare lipoprotein A (peptidoglycan hydrolase)